MSVVITGWRSAIAEAFRGMLADDEVPIQAKPFQMGFPVTARRYLFCHGVLRPKRIDEQTDAEKNETMAVNFGSIASLCDRIIDNSPQARICVIGSESGFRGSYDEVYAVSKNRLHDYVVTKRLGHPGQQLVAISPGIIEDCGMTTRRRDVENLVKRCDQHPKRRFLKARDVAAMAHFLLYADGMDYVSGTVVRMHGGER